MSNPDSSTALLQQLIDASEGLFYISETDAPFEPVQFPQVQDSSLLPAALTEISDIAEYAKVETVTLPYFFRNMTREDSGAEEGGSTASRFRKLQELLEQNLEDVKVYRVGNRRIQAFILGKTATGQFAGLKTTLVET